MRPLHAIAVCCGFAVLVSLISLCQSAEPSHFVADANNKVSANLPSRPMDSKQQSLCQWLLQSQYAIEGKGVFKEEFVTCGGVTLKEINFKTMESRCCPGLYFAGEILDIDGVTGGFNFQNAWTTSYLAGLACADSLTGC